MRRTPLLLVPVILVAACQTTPQAQVPATTRPVNLTMQALGMQRRGEELERARELLEQAAAQGDAEAMDRLGDMYRDGDGDVKRDATKAVEWYRKEAALHEKKPGHGAWGMISLADCYALGRGVEKDVAKSEEWLQKAFTCASEGSKDPTNGAAIDALAYLYMEGKGTNENPRLAWQWALKAAELGVTDAMQIIASLYREGKGVQADESKALTWELKAATKDGANAGSAMVIVSQSYATGTGVEHDEKQAMAWAQKALATGSSRAKRLMGRYFEEGTGVKKNVKEALAWYQKAADQGDAQAMTMIGELHFTGTGVTKDPAEAVKWFTKAAESDGMGEPRAMVWLGLAYREGAGVDQEGGRTRVSGRDEPVGRTLRARGGGGAGQ